MKKCDIYFK